MRVESGIKGFLFAALCLIVAACDATGSGGFGGLGRPAQEGSLRITALIGPPEAVQSRVLGAVANEAAQEGLPIAIGSDSPAEHSITGYLTATTVGRGTQLAYVWDIFDRQNNRVNRVSGEISVRKAADNPWDAVDGDAETRIAEEAVKGIKAWAESQPKSSNSDTSAVPSPRPASGTAPPEAATSTQASNDSSEAAPPPVANAASDATEQAAASTTASPGSVATETSQTPRRVSVGASQRPSWLAPQFAASSTTTPQRNRTLAISRKVPVALGTIKGAPQGTEEAFSSALSSALSPYEVAVASGQTNARHRISADISVSPPEGGNRMAAVIWTVSDNGGNQLGTVRQVNRIAQNATTDQWKSYARQAAERAAYGLAEIIDEN